LQEASAPEGIRVTEQEGWGDWLAPGYEPHHAPTPYVLIATAYFAYSTQLAAQMAEILDKPVAAARHHALLGRIKAAFRQKFISDDGKITSNEQTAYLLALAFDLVPASLRPAMIKHLERAIADKGNHLSTGFLGTPLLTPVLSAIGRSDLAYAVLQQETYPGWLFSVRNGATTIWERWDSWTPADGFNKGGMNSFNHYAYGSVVGWFYDTIAGLKPVATAPGWKQLAIEPTPGGGLTQARATLETPYGLAVSAWRLTDGRLECDVTVPANTQALVALPTAAAENITEAGQPLAALPEVTAIRLESSRVRFQLSAGSYRFVVLNPILAA
jgi:alpha-L-rhamnosidase